MIGRERADGNQRIAQHKPAEEAGQRGRFGHRSGEQRGHKQHGTAAGHDHHDVERGEYLDESRTVQGLDISALQHQHAIFAGLIVHVRSLRRTTKTSTPSTNNNGITNHKNTYPTV